MKSFQQFIKEDRLDNNIVNSLKVGDFVTIETDKFIYPFILNPIQKYSENPLDFSRTRIKWEGKMGCSYVGKLVDSSLAPLYIKVKPLTFDMKVFVMLSRDDTTPVRMTLKQFIEKSKKSIFHFSLENVKVVPYKDLDSGEQIDVGGELF